MLAAAMSCDTATDPLLLTHQCTPPAEGAIVTFIWDSRPDTMRVLICDSATVVAAQSYVATQTGAHIPAGPIVRGAGADTAVPFHFIADSVRLVEVAIELCDGSLMQTPVQVNEYFLGATGRSDAQKAPYCPWGARPISVE